MRSYLKSFDPTLMLGADVSKSDSRRTVMQVTWSLVAGGAEMYALTIASNLDPTRYRSVICAIDQGGALESDARESDIPYVVMDRKPGIDWRLMWRLFKLFRQNRVSIVQTHHFNQLFYSAIGARLCGADLVHTEHSVELYKRRRYRIALRWLSHLCKNVVAIGPDGAGVLEAQVRIPRAKLRVIQAGVNVQESGEPRESAREKLGLAAGDRVVSIIARLYPEKNHVLLLRAFSRVVKEVESTRGFKRESGDCILLIAGEGTERDRIAEETTRLGLNDNVRLLGVRRDVSTLLAASDAFVLCSDREGLPVAVLEAMAAGVPVLATAVGDLPTIIADRISGRLIPPGDEEALAEAMTQLLTDPDSAIRLGRQGRDTVVSRCGLETMIARYENLYT